MVGVVAVITDTLINVVVQYGIAGIALYMMYDIANNHLKAIYAVLLRIEEKLE